MREIEAMVSAMPRLLEGDYSALAPSTLRARMSRPMNVMNLAMNCASYASTERFEQAAREAANSLLGNAMDFPLPALCTVPGLPRLPDAFRAPLQSAHEVLFVSGTFDGRTPPINAQLLARGFPRGRQLVLEGVSHDLFGSARAMDALVAFLNGAP
jgi:pimeloyl-ACP methyl ester carboxylesterase